MKPPYYVSPDGNITIYNGDCRDVLPTLDVAPDVVVADPPYGETSLVWDARVAGWLPLLPRVPLWCFGSARFFIEEGAAFSANGWRFAQDLVWEKQNGSNFHADRFRRVHEQIAHFYPREMRWAAVYKSVQTTPDATARTVRRKTRPTHTGHIEASAYESHDGGPRLMRSVLQVASTHGYAQHPTQKPIGILTPIIAYSCPPGGLILDPFAGVGSTLVAARDSGRRAIGIEISEDYCAIAVERLRQGVFA